METIHQTINQIHLFCRMPSIELIENPLKLNNFMAFHLQLVELFLSDEGHSKNQLLTIDRITRFMNFKMID